MDDVIADAGSTLNDRFSRQRPKGMGNGYGLEAGASEGFRLGQSRVGEGGRANYDCGDSAVFQSHGVVHTARGARPSIGYGSDHEVAPFAESIHHLIGSGAGIDELVQYQAVLKLELLVQNFPQVD